MPTQSLFVGDSSPNIATTQPVWSPDSATLFYHSQIITHTGEFTLTLGNRTIHMADVVTGANQVVLSDPLFNYHLCANYKLESCAWAGDWIQVRRFPHRATEFDFERRDSCGWYGNGCADPVENLALNWRTGEVTAWEDVAYLLTPPIPTADPPTGPNLAASPLYANSEIGYALYVGHDGRSLYCVPDGGTPQKWVQDADWFLYVP